MRACPTSQRIVLSPESAAVRRARGYVKERCQAAGLDPEACEAAALLTSETVTNAFIHGRSEARLPSPSTAAGRSRSATTTLGSQRGSSSMTTPWTAEG